MQLIKSSGVSRSDNMGEMDDLQSRTITWLRFPMAVAVVFIHCFGSYSYSLETIRADPFAAMSIYNWIRIFFSHVVTHIAVPVFFLISGYLFFRKWTNWDKRRYVSKLKSRWHSLIVPYILWNLCVCLYIVASKVGAYFVKGKPLSDIIVWLDENKWLHLFWDNNVWGEDRFNWLGWTMPMSAPIDFPLWFLRDLIVMVFISPVIFLFLKSFRYWGLLFLGIAYLTNIWTSLPGLNVTAVFFYSVGVYIAINGRNIVVEFRKIEPLSYILALFFLFLSLWFDGSNTNIGALYVYRPYVLFGVCAMICIASRVNEKRPLSPLYTQLSQATFFIYAIHAWIIMGISAKIVSSIVTSHSAFASTVSYFLLPAINIAICILSYYLMKRFMPRLLGLLTGNRG